MSDCSPSRPCRFFTELKPGMRARITKVGEDSLCTQRFQEMGLTEGAEFTVIKTAPFGDPVEIDIRGYRLCLRKCEVCSYSVEILTNENEQELRQEA